MEHIRIKIYFDSCGAIAELTPKPQILRNWNITSAIREKYKEQLK
jgi:hypothetical protein